MPILADLGNMRRCDELMRRGVAVSELVLRLSEKGLMERSVEPPGHFLKRHIVTTQFDLYALCTNIIPICQLEGKYLFFINFVVFSSTPYVTKFSS